MCAIVGSTRQVVVKEVEASALWVIRSLCKVAIVLVDGYHVRWIDQDEESTRVDEAVVGVMRGYTLKHETEYT